MPFLSSDHLYSSEAVTLGQHLLLCFGYIMHARKLLSFLYTVREKQMRKSISILSYIWMRTKPVKLNDLQLIKIRCQLGASTTLLIACLHYFVLMIKL